MSTAILIPVRLESTRFPNKPLIDLGGKPMIRRVFDETVKFGYDTYVLTDNNNIAKLLPNENVIMTSTDCTDGTDRCMSVIDNKIKYNKYINVQGDNPNPDLGIIQKLEEALDNHFVYQAYKTMTPAGQTDPTVCKMIITNDVIHWFCRGSLTYGKFALGFHGYTSQAAKIWKTLNRYQEDKEEGIEALRWIQNGYTIKGIQCNFDGIEINIPEDVKKWQLKYDRH
jgi:3-deoxy-manno-octulosonate cytidylyltransferase (CMP-KDO synthetase)